MTLTELVYDCRSFNFSAVSGVAASGNLSASGSGKVVTLTPMPYGLSVGKYVRIAGGSGTAEACVMTAVSGSGGDTIGTITITTANVHTGAWICSSATYGIQEAIESLPVSGGTVSIPNSSDIPIYQSILIGDGTIAAQSTRQNITLTGQGIGSTPEFINDTVAPATQISWHGPASGVMIQVNGPISGVNLSDFYLRCNTGSNGAANGLIVHHAYYSTFKRLVSSEHSGFGVVLDAYENPTGISVGGGDCTWNTIICNSSAATGSGMLIGADAYASSPHLDIARNIFENLSFLCGASGTGLKLQFVDSCAFTGVFTLGCAVGLQITPPSGNTSFPSAISFRDCYFSGTATYNIAGGWAGMANGGLIFMPWPAESGAPPAGTGIFGYTNTGFMFGGWSQADRSAGIGLASVTGYTGLTAQTGNIGATNLYALGVPAGLYRTCVYARVTTAGSAGTLTVTIFWNDPTGLATQVAVNALPLTSQGTDHICFPILHAVDDNTVFTTTVSGATGSPVYSLYITEERLQ